MHQSVAIVTAATTTSVTLIEQKWSATGYVTVPAVTRADGTDFIPNRGSYPIRGWMRKRASAADQSFITPNSIGGPAVIPVQWVAQTFTVGRSGVLSRIDVQLYKNTGAVVDVTLEIHRVVSGMPDTAAPLIARTIPISNLPVWDTGSDPSTNIQPTSVDVLSGNLSVSAGDQLAIVLKRPGGAFSQPWVICASGWAGVDGYPRGAAYVYPVPGPWRMFATSGGDVGFQTYVSP